MTALCEGLRTPIAFKKSLDIEHRMLVERNSRVHSSGNPRAVLCSRLLDTIEMYIEHLISVLWKV